jgi:hypothetical protein
MAFTFIAEVKVIGAFYWLLRSCLDTAAKIVVFAMKLEREQKRSIQTLIVTLPLLM